MIVAFLAWLGAALAAVPVELPSGEPSAAWSEAARLAGARIGPAGAAPSARVVARDGRWTIEVLARDGTRHTLVVPAPTDAAAREDLLATVVSLAEPVAAALPALPPVPLPPVPLPTAPSAPPRSAPAPSASARSPSAAAGSTAKRAPTASTAAPPPAPKPTVADPAVAEPAVADQAVADPAVAEPAVADQAVAEPAVAEPAVAEEAVAEEAVAEEAVAEEAVAEPAVAEEGVAEPAPDEARPPLLDLDTPDPSPPPRVPLHARVATGAVVRLDAAPAPFLEVAGGVGLGRVRVGLAVAGAPDAALRDDRAVRWLDVAAVAELGDRGPWGAVRLGASVRGWSEAGAPVGTTVTPTARLDLGWGFPLGASTLRPGAWAAVDLAPTTLYVAGIEERELDRAFFGLDLGIAIFRAEE